MSEFQDSKRKKFKEYSLKLFNKSDIPIDTIIDIGSKTKTPDLINNFPDAFHYLIEPVVEFCAQIPDNYVGIKYEIINKAALDKSGTVTLGVRTNHGDSITHSTVTTIEKPTEELREIEALTVDELVADKSINPETSILKIDVDGNDMEILKGATETLHNIAMLIIEVPVYEMLQMNTVLAKYPLFLWDICDLTYYKKKLVQCDLILLNKTHLDNRAINPWIDGSFNMAQWKIGM